MPNESWPLIGTLIAALVTAISWVVFYRQAQATQLRKDRLELVNRQLAEFYGPLHIACVAANAAYGTLLTKLGRKAIFGQDRQPTEDELKEWFHWMKYVLMPLNVAREKIVLEKLHLLRETKAPKEIREFASHVACYRALLAKWENGDFTEQYALADFPRDLNAYAERSFAELKREQERLIGALKK